MAPSIEVWRVPVREIRVGRAAASTKVSVHMGGRTYVRARMLVICERFLLL